LIRCISSYPVPSRSCFEITAQSRAALSVYFEIESQVDRFFSSITRLLPNAG
jgi:hypothetical protein